MTNIELINVLQTQQRFPTKLLAIYAIQEADIISPPPLPPSQSFDVYEVLANHLRQIGYGYQFTHLGVEFMWN